MTGTEGGWGPRLLGLGPQGGEGCLRLLVHLFFFFFFVHELRMRPNGWSDVHQFGTQGH